jgi:hypothetical protein
MMEKLIRWFIRLPQWLKLLMVTLTVVIPIYLSAFLSLFLKQQFETTNVARYIPYVKLIVLSIVIVIYFFSYKFVEYAYRRFKEKQELKKNVLTYAYSLVERFVTEVQASFFKNPKSFYEVAEVGRCALENIQLLVEKLYSLFEAKYGQSEEFEKSIKFEVTFMTLSARDNKITIPAFANKAKRAPLSMSKRSEQPAIYDNTVTASIYREQRPSTKVVENTHDPKENYSELYAEQRKRIQSSIIFPVLSPSNQILGTLVVHCNKIGFFSNSDADYWNELLEIFSKYIGTEKIKLDHLAEKHGIRLY